MSKAVTGGQARSLIASFAVDTPWSEITCDIQPFIELSPKERGERFAAFLRNGCRIESIGIANFGFAGGSGALVPWFHEKQTNAGIKGTLIYKDLRETGLIKTFASLEDLEEIKKKGLADFRKNFRGKTVFAWRSVADRGNGSHFVPYLAERAGEIVLDWRWLGLRWHTNEMALRHEGQM